MDGDTWILRVVGEVSLPDQPPMPSSAHRISVLELWNLCNSPQRIVGERDNTIPRYNAHRAWAKLLLDRCRDLVQTEHPKHPRGPAQNWTNDDDAEAHAHFHHHNPREDGGA